MKFLIVFVFLYVSVRSSYVEPGITTTIGCDSQKRAYGLLNYQGDQNQKCSKPSNPETDKNFLPTEDDVSNKDNFVRPCSFKDWNCIRRFLQKNSKCIPKYGPVPEPLCLPQNTLIIPYSNITVTLVNVLVTGMANSSVREFYYNNKTKNVVLGIEVPRLNETIGEAYFRFQRTLMESIVNGDSAGIVFNNVVFTIIIPKIPNLRFELAEIHAYVPDSNPKLFINDKAYATKDPEAQEEFNSYITHIGSVLHETFYLQSQLFMPIFVQTFLCDFGFKVYSL